MMLQVHKRYFVDNFVIFQAANIIQRFVRRGLQLQFERRVKAATCLQSLFRGYQVRCEIHRQHQV